MRVHPIRKKESNLHVRSRVGDKRVNVTLQLVLN